MKKVLILGGSFFQVPAIQKVVELGYYVILCDLLKDVPGKQYAHEFYQVSTSDKKSILKLAQSLQIDGILCYGADSGAQTAAFVAEKMGLPTYPLEAVEVLTNKELFRKFQRRHKFNTPKAKGYSRYAEVKEEVDQFRLPLMIKPVDSSGSRGISIVRSVLQLEEKVNIALSHSKVKRFIVEEYIENYGPHVGGEGFVVNGELVFRCFSNEQFSTSQKNPFISVIASWPYMMPQKLHLKIHNEIQRLITLLNLTTGALNFDIRIDENENVYLIEVAPRNGGACNCKIIQYNTGIDLIEYTIKASLGEDCSDLKQVEPTGYWSDYVIVSQQPGKFREIKIDEHFSKKHLVEYELLVNPGQDIDFPEESYEILGTMVLRFSSMEEMLKKMKNIHNWVKVNVETRNKLTYRNLL
ncbi:biotin carboxylase [Ureibacillus xyleni]|uniref:Biotin carboxylase n=1 Tax=Ureibacillus xyleni TaxID=614648 RepID=A0A285RHH8_9BACL|nr:ATP-grasp domain-containing protein [Ureibacillus xyleni]SOB93585.1 biotin carboxylase [Ureibacillus xyleni]